MSALPPPAKPRGLAQLLGLQRVLVVLALSVALGLLFGVGWKSGLFSLLIRTVALGLVGLLVFGIFEQWPKQMPRWIARWALQLIAVAVAMPVATFLIYVLSTPEGAPAFWHVQERLEGFMGISFLAMLVTPWAVLAALVQQKEAAARQQALTFDLERSELERRALDARLRLLQAQVTPHFLFNTLANVQALVDAGSPQASAVLKSLTAYLRAAVPRLDDPTTTFSQELELVRAYLELMRMRMPDRLEFALDVDEGARELRCPPMTLLTLVENAVRHGIDPSEEGGLIEIEVRRQGDRCLVRVGDTGVGMQQTGNAPGTGLATLRERLRMSFGADVKVRFSAQEPHGFRAELDLPALAAEG